MIDQALIHSTRAWLQDLIKVTDSEEVSQPLDDEILALPIIEMTRLLARGISLTDASYQFTGIGSNHCHCKKKKSSQKPSLLFHPNKTIQSTQTPKTASTKFHHQIQHPTSSPNSISPFQVSKPSPNPSIFDSTLYTPTSNIQIPHPP